MCFLDVTEEVVVQRADFGGERYELAGFQRKVRENFVKLHDPSWVTVSTDRPMGEVEEDLYHIVLNEVVKGDKEVLGKLWV